MKTTKKNVIVLQDVSSKRFLGERLGCSELALDSLNFAQTFKSLTRAGNRAMVLNAALRRADRRSGKNRKKRFVVRFISESLYINSDFTAANPRRPAL